MSDQDPHPFDIFNRALMAERAKVEQLQEASARAEFLRVLSLPEGRALMWRIITECGVLGGSFDPASDRLTAYHEGQRAIGLSLLQQIQTVQPNFVALVLDDASRRTAQNVGPNKTS